MHVTFPSSFLILRGARCIASFFHACVFCLNVLGSLRKTTNNSNASSSYSSSSSQALSSVLRFAYPTSQVSPYIRLRYTHQRTVFPPYQLHCIFLSMQIPFTLYALCSAVSARPCVSHVPALRGRLAFCATACESHAAPAALAPSRYPFAGGVSFLPE